jgi:hypothetical protein
MSDARMFSMDERVASFPKSWPFKKGPCVPKKVRL